MFKNDFQGGTHFEVFSAQGKDPTQNWKLTGGSGIKKEFDKSVKSYVYVLDGSAATTKMQLPKDPRHTLALVQRYLVLQLYVPKGADFSVDLGVQDLTGSKRRLHFSTAIRETSTTPLHSKVPLSLINRELWCNLCIDLSNFVTETWTGQTYKSIDSICLSANCRLRRIFTLRVQPPDTSNDEGTTFSVVLWHHTLGHFKSVPTLRKNLNSPSYFNQELYGPTGTGSGELEAIPRQCQLAPDIAQATQVLNFIKLLHFEGKRRQPPEIVFDSSAGSALDISGSSSSRHPDGYHIAFGTKMPGKKASIREGVNTSRTSKPHSARLKSESSLDLPPSHRQSSAPAISHSDPANRFLRSVLARDRKNSDPGTNQEDPEMCVDKDSLRTSHTWTDGADSGKEGIPFVRPHPPREPSADRIHRKPRVKSAGKERSSAGKERTSAGKERSSAVSTREEASSSGSQTGLPAAQPHPSLVTDVQEASEMNTRLQGSTQRGVLKSESESDGNSANTSGAADDSLDEVIATLKTTGLSKAREYEDTDDDEDEEDDEEQVFLYSSRPKSAPRHKKSRKLSQRHKARWQQAPGASSGKARATSEESDFVRAGSSEEEESLMTRVLRHHPSPRLSPVTSHGVQAETDVPQHHLNGDVPALRASLRSPYGEVPADRSPLVSQSRMSIRKKSLREIPKDDVRLSQQSKPYSPDKYMMDDLSESYEAAMLQSLRRQTLEEGVAESDEESRQPQRHSHLHYSDHSLSDSDSDTDTSRSALRMRQVAQQKEHNYQDEMKSDFLNQSNPRDWGNVFSPPIVFPSQKSTTLISSTALEVTPQTDAHGGRSREGGDTDEEDELDLLYDPVLNCYFDPRTCKYYELV